CSDVCSSDLDTGSFCPLGNFCSACYSHTSRLWGGTRSCCLPFPQGRGPPGSPFQKGTDHRCHRPFHLLDIPRVGPEEWACPCHGLPWNRYTDRGATGISFRWIFWRSSPLLPRTARVPRHCPLRGGPCSGG